MGDGILKFSCCVFGFSHEEECLLALVSHAFFALQECLHDFLEFLFEGVCFPFEEFVSLPGSCDFLFEKLQVPALGH